MTKLRRATIFAPASDTYVASALRTIGYAKHTTGYLPHAVMQVVLTTFHTYLPAFTNAMTLRLMQKIKNKSLKLNKKFEEKKKLEEKTQ